MHRSHGLLLAGIIAALALLATACGGSDGTADETTTTTVAPSERTTTVGETTTSAEAEPLSGDSNSEYCRRVREAQAAQESPLDFSFFGKTPEEIETQFERNLEVFAEWPAVAPPEIKDDAQLIFDFYKQFVERGNELNWNLQAMADDDVFTTAFDNPELGAATANVDTYTRDVCGVDFSQQVAPPPPTGGDDALGELLGDLGLPIPTNFLSEENLACLTTELDPLLSAGVGDDYVPTADDLALVSDAIDTCGIG